MKIKHWQGYGALTTKKLNSATKNGITTIKILVEGNHEYGLDRSDFPEDACHWLQKVIKNPTIDKALNFTGHDAYEFWNCNLKCNYIDSSAIDERGCYLDKAIYEISFRN